MFKINLYLKAQIEAAYKKLGEVVKEINSPLIREEDDPGTTTQPLLNMFMDLSLATKIWNNFGVVRRVMIGALVLFYAHLGMDFTAPLGTELWAPARSVVVKVRRSTRKGWGNFITIRIIEGYWQGLNLTFCHCQDIADLKKGDELEAGQVIAWVGSTGNSTAPHVHVMCSYNQLKFTGNHESRDKANVKGFINPFSIFNILGALRENAA